MRKISLQVWGRVQGVGFRFMTKLAADQLKLSGIVRNEEDGSVYIEAWGPDEIISDFIDQIKASPTPSGRVERWELSDLPWSEPSGKFKVT